MVRAWPGLPLSFGTGFFKKTIAVRALPSAKHGKHPGHNRVLLPADHFQEGNICLTPSFFVGDVREGSLKRLGCEVTCKPSHPVSRRWDGNASHPGAWRFVERPSLLSNSLSSAEQTSQLRDTWDMIMEEGGNRYYLGHCVPGALRAFGMVSRAPRVPPFTSKCIPRPRFFLGLMNRGIRDPRMGF